MSGKFCPECGAKKPEPKMQAAGRLDLRKMRHTRLTGKFCPECGAPKPADSEGWTCSCGAVNKGKFCQQLRSKEAG